MPTRIAVDAMGGDDAPEVVVEGAVRAVRDADGALAAALVGPESVVREALATHDADGLAIEVVDAPDVIGMAESPATALKKKPRSSIHVGIGMVKQGAADGFASAGNTGAVMAAATFGLGRLPGVLRPALPAYFPTVEGTCICVDVGANVDVRADYLVQFAQMGRAFAEQALAADDPSVGLVNIGEEPGKGTEAVKEAFAQLSELDGLHFVGNVEGRGVFFHAADVLVCDGFVGNVMLKLGESIATLLPQLVQREAGRQGLGAEAVGGIRAVLQGISETYNYESYGGVPLLGVDGLAMIGHGGSTARAIARMVTHAAELVERGVTARVAEAIAASDTADA